ncbi:hypothetical protein EYF80_004205 [Liparis tanakae]|uniref:Uncharacterized protein n=1 Tax=Liparis tanakae TaxID=230148 RepID=A0A4Z2J807_9TELE|nr:hypothetical protein EYF80_004205 [Liparis tanakae]
MSSISRNRRSSPQKMAAATTTSGDIITKPRMMRAEQLLSSRYRVSPSVTLQAVNHLMMAIPAKRINNRVISHPGVAQETSVQQQHCRQQHHREDQSQEQSTG